MCSVDSARESLDDTLRTQDYSLSDGRTLRTKKASLRARPRQVTMDESRSDDAAAADDQTVDEQQHDRPDDRSDPAGGLLLPTHES